MSAATATEWLTAAGIGVGAFIPGALLILNLDHRILPPLPSVSLEPARAAAEHAAQSSARRVAAWLLVLAWHIEPKEMAR